MEMEAEAQTEGKGAAETAGRQTNLVAKARAVLRRIAFSANKSHWFSACELMIFVLTGGHCIEAPHMAELFGPRPFSHA